MTTVVCPKRNCKNNKDGKCKKRILKIPRWDGDEVVRYIVKCLEEEEE